MTVHVGSSLLDHRVLYINKNWMKKKAVGKVTTYLVSLKYLSNKVSSINLTFSVESSRVFFTSFRCNSGRNGSLVSLPSASRSKNELITHELHKGEMYALLQECSVVLSFFKEML